jgi:ABC-type xylose transport system permease subunit
VGIATIANGIDLVACSDATRLILTGAILLAAVTLDTISRRGAQRQAAELTTQERVYRS